MSRFCDAAGLAARCEDEDEDLFETSSSMSGDSEDEDRFSDGEGYEALEDKFTQQAVSPVQQPVRRLNTDSLYDLSSMTAAQLPVKKGLSRYYDGKARSFACMSEVRCLEDLRKKEIPFKKIKPSKSYVTLDGGSQDCRHVSGPNSRAIAKTPSGNSCANLMARNNSKNMIYRPPPIPVSKSVCHQ